MYKFDLNKKQLDELSELVMLSPLQKKIIEYRIQDFSKVKMAELEHCSVATIGREIKKIVAKSKNAIK